MTVGLVVKRKSFLSALFLSLLLLSLVGNFINFDFVPTVVASTQTSFFSSSTYDVQLYHGDDVWYNVWSASSSMWMSTSGTAQVVGWTVQFAIDRSAWFFDTSGLPDNCVILQAWLNMYGEIASVGEHFDVIVQNGMPTYPHTPPEKSDYNKDHYSGNGGSINTANIPDDFASPFNITLNSDGRSWINKQGWTKFMLRGTRDVNNQEPSVTSWCSITNNRSNKKPKLYVVYGYIPSIGTTTVTSTSGYWYSTHATYEVSVPVTDSDGYEDVTEVRIRLGDSYHEYKWSGTTFSEITDSGSYYTLQTGGTYGGSGNVRTVVFKLKADWTAGDGLKTVYAWAKDSSELTDGWDDEGNLFTVESDLSASSLAVDDYHVNPSQTLTMSGYWYYQGSAVAPPDGNYNVKVKLSGVQKGSTDTSLVSGYFSINDVTAESTVSSYSYTVECDHMLSSGSFSSVIVDRLLITYEANTTNPTVGDYVEITVSAKYDYDKSTATFSYINTYRDLVHFTSSNPFTDMEESETSHNYKCENASDNTYGITTFTTNTLTVMWGGLFIECFELEVDDTRADTNSDVYLRYHLRYSYNQSECQLGTLWVNGTSHTISSGWANFTVTNSSVLEASYVVTGVNVGGETDYGQVPSDPQIVWDRAKVEIGGVGNNHLNVNDSTSIWFRLRYEYDNVLIDGGSVKFNGTSATYSSVNLRWELSVQETTVGNRSFCVSDVAGNTYGITAINHDADYLWVAWDGLNISSQQITINSAKLYVRMIYACDGSAVADGTLSYAGSEKSTNSTGWVEYNLVSLPDFSYNTVCWGVQDSTANIIYKAGNQTVPLAKKQYVIQSVNPSITLSNLGWENDELSWSATGNVSATFKIYCTAQTYFLKINGIIKKEGDQWSHSGNVVTVIDTLTSTHVYVLSFHALSTLPSGTSGTSGTTSTPQEFAESVGEALGPAVFAVASNWVAMLTLVGLLVGAFVAYGFQSDAWKYLVVAFGVMAFDFIIVYIVVPLRLLPADLSWLKMLLWKPPTLELAMYPLATQQIIQLLLVGTVFIVIIGGVVAVMVRQRY